MLKHSCGSNAYKIGQLTNLAVAVYLNPDKDVLTLSPVNVRETGLTQIGMDTEQFYCFDCGMLFPLNELEIRCELSGNQVSLYDARIVTLSLDKRVTRIIISKELDIETIKEHFKAYEVSVSENLLIQMEV